MDRINYDQTEGFPLDVNILDFGQKANQITQQLGEIIAPLAIVKGCVENGNNVGDGLVYINGELLPFKAGLKQNVVRIVESSEPRVFENGNSKPVLIMRYATFGAGAGTSYNWTDFHRSISIKEIEKRLVHVGFIQDYYGDVTKLPAGWFLCNGENGTPDLRGMFIVGYDPRDADYNAIENTGGAKEVTLTVNQMPKHKHSGSTSSDGNHSHQGLQVQGSNADNGDPGKFVNTSNSQGNGLQNNAGKTSDAGAHSHTFETNEVGENQAHENRPPFYVLAKIMYKG